MKTYTNTRVPQLISRRGLVINQHLVTQDLKLTLKLRTLIGQHLSWCTKMTKHPIKECIRYSLAGFVEGLHQLNPLGKVLHHH
jgi:hypothetical protein